MSAITEEEMTPVSMEWKLGERCGLFTSMLAYMAKQGRLTENEIKWFRTELDKNILPFDKTFLSIVK